MAMMSSPEVSTPAASVIRIPLPPPDKVKADKQPEPEAAPLTWLNEATIGLLRALFPLSRLNGSIRTPRPCPKQRSDVQHSKVRRRARRRAPSTVSSMRLWPVHARPFPLRSVARRCRPGNPPVSIAGKMAAAHGKGRAGEYCISDPSFASGFQSGLPALRRAAGPGRPVPERRVAKITFQAFLPGVPADRAVVAERDNRDRRRIPHHEQVVSFVGRQLLDAVSPANFIATNPEVLSTTIREGGKISCGER